MDFVLDDVEVRVLGCLMEKKFTTPEYYPLTLNALINACNQKSNRNPVVKYDETTVLRGLDGLRDKGLATRVIRAESRVPKFEHLTAEKLGLDRAEEAVMCESLLRGQQTPGELRSRADRMHSFSGLAAVEEILEGLTSRGLMARLPRQPGRKENRYAHLLAGEPMDLSDVGASPSEEGGGRDRLKELEVKVDALKAEMDSLKKEFERFSSLIE